MALGACRVIFAQAVSGQPWRGRGVGGKMAASLWLSGGGERVLRLLRAGRSALGAGLSLPARAGWRHLHGTRELLGEWRTRALL